jgi:hypothetical protein
MWANVEIDCPATLYRSPNRSQRNMISNSKQLQMVRPYAGLDGRR